MTGSTLYSIGHGNKKMEDFIAELKFFNIEFLIDVRSKPYSKWNPHFCKTSLNSELNHNGIKYVYLGDKLGGLPEDKDCYVDGKVDYELLKQKDFFRDGLKRIENANRKKLRVAVMCSESKPEKCHRSKLIGEVLWEMNISMEHIISLQTTISQPDVMKSLTKGNGSVGLFGKVNFSSRKAYK